MKKMVIIISILVLFILFTALTLKAQPDGIRMVLVVKGAENDVTLQAVKALGANYIAASIDPVIGAAIHRNGMKYTVYISSADAARLDTDPGWLDRVTAAKPDGFHYMDEIQADNPAGHPLEGYTSIPMQIQTYKNLKKHFPNALVIYPFRADPGYTDPTFLDKYLTVEGSDILAPYFYPVGTPFGPPQTYDGGTWEKLLHDVIAPIMARMGEHRVMSVLQGFTYIINGSTYAVDEHFLTRQQAVYLTLSPAINDATVFDWGGGGPTETLNDLSGSVVLQKATLNLFTAMLPTSPRMIPVRPARYNHLPRPPKSIDKY